LVSDRKRNTNGVPNNIGSSAECIDAPKRDTAIHAVFVTGPKASLGSNPSAVPGIGTYKGNRKHLATKNNDTETSPTVSNGYERIIMGVMTKKARR